MEAQPDGHERDLTSDRNAPRRVALPTADQASDADRLATRELAAEHGYRAELRRQPEKRASSDGDSIAARPIFLFEGFRRGRPATASHVTAAGALSVGVDARASSGTRASTQR